MSKFLLAIDAGTGSARAVLFDLQGNQIAIAQKEWTHKEENGIKNSYAFDYKSGWQIIAKCIQEATQNINKKDILAVSATSMREGVVLYDQNGNEIWAVSNVDSRADKEVIWLKNTHQNLESDQYKTSGQTFALAFIPRLLWLKNNRLDLYEKTASFSMISDWVLYKLSGEIAVEPSNASTTGILSLKTRNFDKSLLEKAGLKTDILPSVLESGEVLGKISQKAADEAGLSTDTLVVMGGGDVQLGTAGLGVVKPNTSVILGGTFWQQIVSFTGDLTDPKMDLRINAHVIRGQNQLEAISFFTGLTMRWFRDAFCADEMRLALETNSDAYTILEEMAKAVPAGSNGVVPIFSDQMHYGKWIHAAPSFINLSIDASLCNKAVLFRALEENAAIVSSVNLDKVEKLTGKTSSEAIFAGGASKGALWSQIVADATNKAIKIPVIKEATALACAFAAGIGAGVYKDFEESANLVRFERTVDPNRENFAVYQEAKARWQEIYKAQLELVNRGLTTPLWKAAGV